jgi:hypothetical protein
MNLAGVRTLTKRKILGFLGVISGLIFFLVQITVALFAGKMGSHFEAWGWGPVMTQIGYFLDRFPAVPTIVGVCLTVLGLYIILKSS